MILGELSPKDDDKLLIYHQFLVSFVAPRSHTCFPGNTNGITLPHNNIVIITVESIVIEVYTTLKNVLSYIL